MDVTIYNCRIPVMDESIKKPHTKRALRAAKKDELFIMVHQDLPMQQHPMDTESFCAVT